MQRQQFQSNLDSELRVWLVDQKSENLSEAARLADQYVAVRKADRPIYKGPESSSRGHATKAKSFGESGRNNPSGGFQKSTPFGQNAKPHTEQKPSATSSSSSKANYFDNHKAVDVCYYCEKAGHILANCRTLRAKREQNEAPVQLASTLSSQVTQGQVSSTVVQNPRLEGHCSLVTLVDWYRHAVRE